MGTQEKLNQRCDVNERIVHILSDLHHVFSTFLNLLTCPISKILASFFLFIFMQKKREAN